MRFIGNKTNLLNDISKVIKDNCDGTEKVFCDIFSGTASVSRFFKNKYTIISNDLLYSSYILQMGTIENTDTPTFDKIRKVLGNVKFFNGAPNLAMHLKNVLTEKESLDENSGKIEFIDSQGLKSKEIRFFNILNKYGNE